MTVAPGGAQATSAPGLDELLDALESAAREGGVEAYLVGGAVRDRLRGAAVGQRLRDVDVLVVGGGDDAAARLLDGVAGRFGWSRPQVFERFGTAQVRGEGWVVEAVGARAERYDPASRNPDVRRGTLDEDIWRRDFTVNALAQTTAGLVLDRTGRGLDDLAAGVLRTPLDPRLTFSEDPLRMYRAARFVARLGYRPAPGLVDAMREEAERADILSVERVRDELRKLLVAPHPRAGMEVLREAGLLARVLPEVAAMRGVEQSGYHVFDVYDHTLAALEHAPDDLVTRTAVLLHDVGKPPCHAVDAAGRHTFHDHPRVGARMAEQILERLRFSNDEVRDVAALVVLHLRPIQYARDTHSDAAVRRLVRDAGPLRARMLDVARADTRASAFPGVAGIDELEERMAALDAGGAVSKPRPPLDGGELMAIAGRGGGPWVGAVQRLLDEEVLEGRIAPGDKPAARAWLEAHPEVLSGDG